MNCSQIRKMISRYVDDALKPEEKKVFLSHVQGCDACRKELEETQQVRQLFASTERFEAPYAFAERVMARIGEAEEQRFSWLRRIFAGQLLFVRAVEVAFALAVILIGLVSGNILTADRPVERQQAIQDSFSLDLFQATPPGSIGGIYVSLIGGEQ